MSGNTSETRCKRITTKGGLSRSYEAPCGLPRDHSYHEPYPDGSFSYPRHRFEPTPPEGEADPNQPAEGPDFGLDMQYVFAAVIAASEAIECTCQSKPDDAPCVSCKANHAAAIIETLRKSPAAAAPVTVEAPLLNKDSFLSPLTQAACAISQLSNDSYRKKQIVSIAEAERIIKGYGLANQAQPPCSECATPSEINLPWTVSGDSPSKPPMVWDASGDSIVNQMPDGTPYFEPEVAAFIGKAANSLATHETECATLQKQIARLREWNNTTAECAAQQNIEKQAIEAECATLRKDLEDETRSANEMTKAALQFERKFSAAEAQLSTLRDTLEQAIKRQQKITREGHEYCWACGEQNGKHKNELNHAPCAAGEMEKIRAALAPTPEVAPKE